MTRSIEHSQSTILAVLGITPSGDEWTDYTAIAQTLALGSYHTWESAWDYIADQVLTGFKVDPQSPEAPTTQLLKWQQQRWAERWAAILDPEGTRQRLKEWADKAMADFQALAEQINEWLGRNLPDAADPPTRRLEARNLNPPKKKHESPRWAPPTKRGRRK